MHNMKAKFSPIAWVLGLGVVFSANAAPSVRVLGSGAGYSTGVKTATEQKPTAVKTGNNISANVLGTNSGAKKSASIKTVAPKSMAVAPISRASSNRTGSIVPSKAVSVKTGTERFPGIASKANIQSVSKTSGISASGKPNTTTTSGYNIKDMDDRLNTIEDTVSSKVDNTTLDNYYTKEEINNNYYTAQQMEERLSDIDASASSQYIRFLTQTINLHSEQIQDLASDDGGIYDMSTGEKKAVYLVSEFNEDAVLNNEQQTGQN